MASTVAAISQLVATGAIDQELTKNPSVTYWRYQHFRHTAFALENQILVFSSGQFGPNSKSTCTLHRSGDLVSRMYVIIDLPGIANVSKTDVAFAATGLQTHLGAMGMADTSAVTADATNSPGEAVEADIAAAYADNGGMPLSDQAVGDTSLTGGSVPYWCHGVGFRLIKEASLLIGSQTIDTVYSDFLFMFNELSKKPQKSIDEMIGCGTPEELKKRSKFYRRLHVPLPFFCTKTTGSALPIVSLQFHTVAVSIDWNDLSTCIVNNSGISAQNIEVAHPDGSGATVPLRTVVRTGERDRMQTGANKVMTVFGRDKTFGAHVQTVPPVNGIVNADVQFHLECMYVYLDLAERSKFSSGSFQLLMSEAQKNNSNVTAATSDVEIDLNFNHAVIELMWAVRSPDDKAKNFWFDYGGVVEPVTGTVRDPVKNVKLTLNNSNRFTENNNGSYFRTIQPYQHHSNIPKSFVYSYSFGLFPESENPSGQANFSRIDSKKLHLKLDSNLKTGSEVIVFARNWNLLRVTLGLAGKAYAN